MANVGAIPVLISAGDVIIMDALSHSCLHAGAKLSGAQIEIFAHNDVEDAARALAQHTDARRKLILTETIFSMDGDAAPLDALSALAEQTGAWLMTDDAHGFGVIKQDNPAPIQMGTLSKGAGGYGGYVCGPAPFVDLLTSRARSFVYTTGLPPGTLGAASAALDIIANEPERGERACSHAQLFASLTNQPKPAAAIAPIIVGESQTAMALSDALIARGFLVSAIRPPTVAEGAARLRCSFAATHEEDDVRALATAVNDLLKEYQ